MANLEQPELIPQDNLPGHHPDHEQDKPSGLDFAAKTHALAVAAEADSTGETVDPQGRLIGPPEDRDDEVLDLRDALPVEPSERAERLATLAGTPLKLAGDLLQKVRNRL